MRSHPLRTLFIIIIILLSACTGKAATPTPTLSPTALPPTATPTPSPSPTPEPVPWWNQAVFYEVFVRSFADATSGHLANDGIGDLQGLMEKLDYLNDGDPNTSTDLGVTALWLMPIMQSPSYHGYDVSDYYSVNTDYGYNVIFKQFMQAAHQRGMRVIIDLVLNHTSSENPWFVSASADPNSPYRDWYIWSQDKPHYLGPAGEDIWRYSPTGYYYGLFSANMPDLNYNNPQVTTEMDKVARFWLEEMGVDGFRLDAARHLIEEGQNQVDTASTHAWWKQFRTAYKAADPEAMTVGEIWTNRFAAAQYVKGDELDLAFDFSLQDALIGGVNARSAAQLQGALTTSYNLFGSGTSGIFLSNHDMNRVMSRNSGQMDKAKLAAMVLLTAPGVPFIYYGEEIGMTGTKPDLYIRTPMQWSAQANAGFTAGTPWVDINPDYAQVNVAAEAQDPDSLLSCYRSLIHFRNTHPALQSGAYLPVESGSKTVLAYLRSNAQETLLVLINLGREAASDYRLSLKAGPFSGEYGVTLVYGGEETLPTLTANGAGGFDAYQPGVEIPASGMIVIQLLTGK
jgi:alpha-amylase